MTAKKISPRAPRPDGEVTRIRLLEAAGRLFSQQGFAETTSKAIAGEAGVDLALINYHFGNRGGLYQAVLLEAHQRVVGVKDLRKIADAHITGEQRLFKLMDGMVLRARRPDAWHSRVLARELMAPSSHLNVLLEEAVPPKLLAVKKILSEISGIAEDDPAILRCLLSVITPCMILVVFGHDIPGPLHQTTQMPRTTLVKHLHTFAVAGLKAVGAAHRGAKR